MTNGTNLVWQLSCAVIARRLTPTYFVFGGKRMKRLISALLLFSIIMTVGCNVKKKEPVDPPSKEPVYATGTTGDCTWVLEGTKLTVSGNGAMADHYDGCMCIPEVQEWGRDITEVIIEDGVTALGNGVFYGCTKLVSISIPDSVTSLGIYTFMFCESLENIDMPDKIDTIHDGMFIRCLSLTSVVIPEGVTCIRYGSFNSCENLESINIPDSVKEINNNAFIACEKLATVYIDSAEIAQNLTDTESCGFLVKCANTVYVRSDIETVGKALTSMTYKKTGVEVNGVTYNVYSKQRIN